MIDLNSWLTGYALGLAGKPLPLTVAKKTLIGYSYNGVVLPELPEWDRESYPYAMICKHRYQDMKAALMCSAKPFTFEESSGNWCKTLAIGADAIVYDHLYEDDSEWAPNVITDYNGTPFAEIGYVHLGLGYEPLWANHDVYLCEYDGGYVATEELYLAASEPVPVYE